MCLMLSYVCHPPFNPIGDVLCCLIVSRPSFMILVYNLCKIVAQAFFDRFPGTAQEGGTWVVWVPLSTAMPSPTPRYVYFWAMNDDGYRRMFRSRERALKHEFTVRLRKTIAFNFKKKRGILGDVYVLAVLLTNPYVLREESYIVLEMS